MVYVKEIFIVNFLLNVKVSLYIYIESNDTLNYNINRIYCALTMLFEEMNN